MAHCPPLFLGTGGTDVIVDGPGEQSCLVLDSCETEGARQRVPGQGLVPKNKSRSLLLPNSSSTSFYLVEILNPSVGQSVDEVRVHIT